VLRIKGFKLQREELPLAPYRVLDLADEKGAFCARILGDLGAQVIKIEKPNGDPARNRGPFYQDIPHPERSLHWFVFNANKKGITLDIETADGREILRNLGRSADFLVESFPPGYLDKLGLGYTELSAINPRIILVSITPFGQAGPYSHYNGCDIVYMAMGGLMVLSGDPDRAPLRISVEQSYFQTGAQAAAGALIAHHHRRVTGRGQHVDVSIQEAAACASQFHWGDWAMRGLAKDDAASLKREGNRVSRGRVKPRIIWPTKDGYVSWRIFVAAQGRRTRALTKWMEDEDVTDLKDIQWEALDFNDLTQEQLEAWEEVIGKFFLSKTNAELHQGAVERGIILYPVNTTRDLAHNPQLKARGFWAEVDHPELRNRLTYPAAAFKSSEYYCGVRHRAPLIGEHNREIYQKELGLTAEELRVLKEAGVI